MNGSETYEKRTSSKAGILSSLLSTGARYLEIT